MYNLLNYKKRNYKHKKKPMEARKRIEQLFANVNKIELFVRENQENWDAWGNEVEVCTDISQYCA